MYNHLETTWAGIEASLCVCSSIILVFKSVNLLNLGQCTILNLSMTSRSTVLFVDERKLTPNYLHLAV